MAEQFPQKIAKFVKEHHVLTVATCVENQSWCFNAYYAFDEERHALLVTSHDDTRHVSLVQQNSLISGTIVLETENLARVQGLQFAGTMELCQGDDEKRASKIYVKRFPFAAITPKTMWSISLEECKFTDNTLGFGKKLNWTKNL